MRILFLVALLMPATSFAQASAPDTACVPYRPNKTTVRPAGSSANLPVNLYCGGNTITQSIGPGSTTDPAKERTAEPGKKGETDFLVLIGVVLTFLLGLINLYFTLRSGKRTAFVNTVTSERVKWLGKVRANVSTLCSLCNQWMIHRTQDGTPDLQRKIEQLKNEIRLQLNPSDPADVAIAEILDRLPTWTVSMDLPDYRLIEAELIAATQAMLKREWDKVKDESIHGDLREVRARKGDA